MRTASDEKEVEVKLSQHVAASLVRIAETLSSPRTKLPEDLTRQEMKMLEFLGRGYSNQEIASHLILSVSTVRSHLKHLYKKLGVSSRGEAIALSIRAARGSDTNESTLTAE